MKSASGNSLDNKEKKKRKKGPREKQSSGPVPLHTMPIKLYLQQKANNCHINQEEDFYRRVSENMQDLVSILDKNGKYKYVSPSHYALLGYQSNELLLKNPLEFIHPDDRKRVEKIYKYGFHQDHPKKIEFRFRTKYNGYRWIEITGKELLDPEGKREGSVISGRDISERKLSENREKEYIYQLRELNKNAIELIDLPPGQNFHALLAKKLHGIIPWAIVAVTSYDPYENSLHIESVQGLGQFQDIISRMMGQNVLKLRFKLADIQDKSFWEGLSSDKLIEYKEWKNGIGYAGVSKAVTKVITNMMGIEKMYEIGIQWNKVLQGNVGILLKKGDSLAHEELIETLVKQFAMAMQRDAVQQDLAINEKKFRSAFQTAPGAFVISREKDGLLHEVNDSFELITGYKKEEVIGKTVKQVRFWHEKSPREEIIEQLQRDSFIHNKEIYFYHKDGSARVGLFSANTLIFNKERYILSSITDITPLKQTQHDLLLAKERAEEADKLKTAFLANMSHEIRTPMNGIIGFVQLLQQKELNPEKKKLYLDIIKNRSQDLLRIINDILDISQIEAGKILIRNRALALNPFLEDIFQYYHERIQTETLPGEVEFMLEKAWEDDLHTFTTDPNRLKQLLTNLIDNAIKFTPRGSIRFGYQEKDEHLLFFVEDTGLGIPVEKQEIVFERFRQAEDSPMKNFGGTGLGLSICKGLVDLMGGQIWFESQKGHGSKFFFTLPKTLKE